MNTEEIYKHLQEIKQQLNNLSVKPKKERVKREPTEKQKIQREKFKEAMKSLHKPKEEPKEEIKPEIEKPKKGKKKNILN